MKSVFSEYENSPFNRSEGSIFLHETWFPKFHREQVISAGIRHTSECSPHRNNGGYWAGIITKRDEAELRQWRACFRSERGKGPLVVNPLWRARESPPRQALTYVQGETAEEGTRIMRDVVRKHPLYEPPCSASLVPNAQRAEGAVRSLFPNRAPSNANDDDDGIRCWQCRPWTVGE